MVFLFHKESVAAGSLPLRYCSLFPELDNSPIKHRSDDTFIPIFQKNG